MTRIRCRCWGLNDWAAENIYDKCLDIRPRGRAAVMLDGYDLGLVDHIMSNGKVYREVIQAIYWSGRQDVFCALRDVETGEIVQESLWTLEEIRRLIP